MPTLERPHKEPGLIYDAGMHKGEDADYYLKKGFRVVGFEADPDLVAHCRRRFAAEIRSGDLTIVEGAIVEFPSTDAPSGTIRFFRNKDDSVWGTVVDDWARRNEGLGTTNEIVDVPAVDFVSCLRQYGVPHYLKIDIEGMDVACLRGLRHFEQKPDYLSIESEKASFARLEEEIDLLMELGYAGFKAVNQARVHRQREPECSEEGRRLGYRFRDGASGLFGADLPGKWMDRGQILKRYRRVFRGYRLLGDHGKLSKTPIKPVVGRLAGFPGWYDTHARHGSVVTCATTAAGTRTSSSS